MSPSTTAAQGQRDLLLGIQYLRAVAALMIAVHHTFHQVSLSGYRLNTDSIAFLPGGVDIFFVISGFVMWHTTCGSKVSPSEFMWRRCVRIVPLYWCLTTFVVCIMIAMPQAMQSGGTTISHAIASYLFFPWPRPNDPSLVMPVLIAGWTLNYEMFFYAVFAICLLVDEHRRIWLLTGALLGFVLAKYALDKPESVALQFYTSEIMLEFAAGALLGYAWPHLRSIGIWPVVAMSAIGWIWLAQATLLETNMARLIAVGGPSLLIVTAVVIYERNYVVPLSSLGKLLGDASYSIYLSQAITLSALGQLWRRTLGIDGPFACLTFIVVATLAATIIGILIYWLVERPLIAYFRPFGTRYASRRSAI